MGWRWVDFRDARLILMVERNTRCARTARFSVLPYTYPISVPPCRGISHPESAVETLDEKRVITCAGCKIDKTRTVVESVTDLSP